MKSSPLIRIPLLTGVCLATLAVTPCAASAQDGQDAPEEAQSPQEQGEESDTEIGSGSSIVVEGERLRGQLNVEQAPILELNEEDIAAEGVTSIADLVTQITNQTGSSRGRGGGKTRCGYH